MVIMARVSRGTKMDQIYIPKNREGLSIGSYVLISLLEEEKKEHDEFSKLYFYNIKSLEPVKLSIINKIIRIIDKNIKKSENIIITGSFLDKGFNFNDIDILIIDGKTDEHFLAQILEKKLGIKAHIIKISKKEIIQGLATDPLYQAMLNECIAKKRFVYRIKRKIDYKILDLHLLKSKSLIDNFDILNGREKYYLVRNVVAIYLFVKRKRISKDSLDKEIKSIWGTNTDKIKDNMLDKGDFIKRYRVFYEKVFDLIMGGAGNGAKQK